MHPLSESMAVMINMMRMTAVSPLKVTAIYHQGPEHSRGMERRQARNRRRPPMDLQLKGKTALVTGASMGIGRAIARVLRWKA